MTMAKQDTKEVKLLEKITESELRELIVHPEVNEDTDSGGAIPKPQYIYIIGESSLKQPTGYYKIGKTDDWEERIKNLQTGNARELYYCRVIQVWDMTAAEKAAHDKVAVCRAKDGGGKEWFFVPQEWEQKFITLFSQAISNYRL